MLLLNLSLSNIRTKFEQGFNSKQFLLIQLYLGQDLHFKNYNFKINQYSDLGIINYFIRVAIPLHLFYFQMIKSQL